MHKKLITHPRFFLSEIRGGDFAHVGDAEAVKKVITTIEALEDEIIYLRKLSWMLVVDLAGLHIIFNTIFKQ